MVTVSSHEVPAAHHHLFPMQVNFGLKEKEFRHPTGVFNIPPEEFLSNVWHIWWGPWEDAVPHRMPYDIWKSFPPFSCKVSLLISTPPRCCNGWLIHPCKFFLLIIRRPKILIADVIMRSEDAMGNTDVCTCLLDFHCLTKPTHMCWGKYKYSCYRNSLQSFLPFGGNYYF